jgi:hypothetical protein
MDTGAYMANQMDDLIEAGIRQREYEWEQLVVDIETYITECGYTWTMNTVIEQYHKYKRGEYICHTAKDMINKFKHKLDIFYER